MSAVEQVLAKVIAAHGGAEFWQRLGAIEAVLSADGFLFTTKRVPPLRQVRVRAETTVAAFTFFDFPRPGCRGEWHGEEEVRIVAADGTVIDRRQQPRAAFAGLRRQFWWDDLDFLFFAGYATWNYLLTPFLFLRPGFEFRQLPSARDGSFRLAVRFPAQVPSHCRDQVFNFSPEGDLLRLDYTAEVVGHWAHAAHLCSGYRDFGGLRAPTYRRVRPLFGLANPLPFPTLVAIDVHELRPLPATGN